VLTSYTHLHAFCSTVPCYFFLQSHPIPSHRITSHRIASHRIRFHPVPSDSIRFHPIPSESIRFHPIPSESIRFHPIPSGPFPPGVCPAGRAIADMPTAANKAHALAECSGKGTCNRLTGQCRCAPPYEGSACQRSTSIDFTVLNLLCCYTSALLFVGCDRL
jgi:hypothetical protein